MTIKTIDYFKGNVLSEGAFYTHKIPKRIYPNSKSYKSEIRAIFMHSASNINPNFDLITQTINNYGIKILGIEIMGNNYAHYPSAYIPSGEYVLSDAITACHAIGIEIHPSMNVLLGSLSDSYKVTSAAGPLKDWTCPTKTITRTLIQNLMTELGSYDIDGFMFDYIRYDDADVCYCSECKAAFELYIGESIETWPGDFAPGGPRYDEFNNWRTIPVNNLVRDMRTWLLAVNPDLIFSAAVFQYLHEGGLDYPAYWRTWIGQDWAYWVSEGWIDWVAPMMYTTDESMIAEYVQSSLEYGLGGPPEGKMPLAPFLANCYPASVDPNVFKLQIDAVRNNEGDGWIIWRYGGPGDGEGSTSPDIRDYLDVIGLPSAFTILPISVNISSSKCDINWITDSPVSSKVEYSPSPLFTKTWDVNYWRIDHAPGTTIQSTINVTDHNILLTDLQANETYYFRVQSQDSSTINTSLVTTFLTKDIIKKISDFI